MTKKNLKFLEKEDNRVYRAIVEATRTQYELRGEKLCGLHRDTSMADLLRPIKKEIRNLDKELGKIREMIQELEELAKENGN